MNNPPCAANATGGRDVEDRTGAPDSRGAALVMEVWPFGAALQGEAQTALSCVAEDRRGER